MPRARPRTGTKIDASSPNAPRSRTLDHRGKTKPSGGPVRHRQVLEPKLSEPQLRQPERHLLEQPPTQSRPGGRHEAGDELPGEPRFGEHPRQRWHEGLLVRILHQRGRAAARRQNDHEEKSGVELDARGRIQVDPVLHQHCLVVDPCRAGHLAPIARGEPSRWPAGAYRTRQEANSRTEPSALG